MPSILDAVWWTATTGRGSKPVTPAQSVLAEVFALLDGVAFDFGVQRKLHALKATLESHDTDESEAPMLECQTCGNAISRETADRAHVECAACLRRPRCVNCQADLTRGREALFVHQAVTVGPFCRTCRDVLTFGAATTEG